MARQKSLYKLVGTLGDFTFLKTQDGYLTKEKTSISGDRIANDPSFARTRENGSEFGRAGKASKTMRRAIQTLLQNSKDNRLVSRLTGAMIRVEQTDQVNDRGQRTVYDGDTTLLKGFDFNIDAQLSSTLYAPYTTSVDRVLGLLSVQVPSIIPSERIAAPQGATHFKISSLGTEIDFEGESYVTDVKETAILPLDNIATVAMNFDNQVTTNSGHPLFILLGIQFFQMVNGKQYSLRNGAFNALSIVAVDPA